MRIPDTRGPISSALFAALSKAPDAATPELDGLHRLVSAQVAGTGDIIADEDIQLSLFCLYELHYSGLDGVSDAWEWEPALIRVRRGFCVSGSFEAE